MVRLSTYSFLGQSLTLTQLERSRCGWSHGLYVSAVRVKVRWLSGSCAPPSQRSLSALQVFGDGHSCTWVHHCRLVAQ